MPICNYCDKEFVKEFKHQVYCSIPCRKKMTKIKKKFRQKGYDGTLHPRTCIRCGESFHFYGMKKLCQPCVEVCKENPYEYKLITY